GYFGKSVLREVDENIFYSSIPQLREKYSDRAILRAIHFFDENKRVEMQRAALKNTNIDEFLKYVLESGNSSYKYLQNVYVNTTPTKQSLSLALALCESMGITARVHGGGFAGTIQAFCEKSKTNELKNRMDNIYGNGSCMILNVRPCGAIKII
ncbi:galactokinase, partial [Eubacteriales bacterium OttesenSCG-928-G02]|nr:galactokinase [Eubacteriales bacterium OttesenSCG-928-G02]